MTTYTELPERPEPDSSAAVVLDTSDPLFIEAVRSWGPEWDSRVTCWRAVGSQYGVVVATPNAGYFKLYAPQDETTLEKAIESALKSLGGARCRWRACLEVRSLVWSCVRRDYDRRRREKRRLAVERPSC